MPSRLVLIDRGLVLQILNQDNSLLTCKVTLASTKESTRHHNWIDLTKASALMSEDSSSSAGKSYGGLSEREIPGPIPNPEVKPLSADGTATEGLWESRTSPDILSRRPPAFTQVASLAFRARHERRCSRGPNPPTLQAAVPPYWLLSSGARSRLSDARPSTGLNPRLR